MPELLPTGTVTFLFSDIEGSTALAGQYPDEMPALLDRHHAILRQSIQAHDGRLFRILGDGVYAAFFTASTALGAAIQAQHALNQEDWQPAPIKVRMGIHTGPALAGNQDADGDGYTGYLTLARVQRIMSTACGGQVLLSSTTAGLIQEDLPAGVRLRDMGEHRLKGLLNPEHLWQVIAPGLPSEFPPLQTLNTIPNNLPVQLSSFIGRERELAEVKRLLSSTRLLTLTGVGGSGKTRLSLQAAAEILDEFKDGAWFVELASVTDPDLLVQTVATALGVREAPGWPLSVALEDYLRAKNLLLILDNCEHLIRACAELADRLLHSCRQLTLIASSREALGITGESVMHVPSLALPGINRQPSVDDLVHTESAQLFLERARSVQPHFTVTDQNSAAIAQICRRLDGIPLAIELAAVRVKMFSPEQILERLDDRFRLLTGGSRTALPRQQTLRALIDWSYDLLTEADRILLRRLSVFTGGWSFEAANIVARQDEGPSADILDGLIRLIDKSLVLVEEPGHGDAVHYRFLETVRQYARDKLLESGEAANLRNRHMQYYLEFAAGAERQLIGAEQLEWLDRIDIERDNLRTALAWGVENDAETALRLANALWNYWIIRDYTYEGLGWLARALERFQALPEAESEAMAGRLHLRAKALLVEATLYLNQGNSLKSAEAALEAVQMARQIGDTGILAPALLAAGIAEGLIGNSEIAIPALKEGITLSQDHDSPVNIAMGLEILARFSRMQGDLQKAYDYFEEALKASHGVLDLWQKAISMLGFGRSAAYLREYAKARTYFEKSIELFIRIGDKNRTVIAHSELAHLERRQGHYEQALLLYRNTILSLQDMGYRAAIAHELECFAIIAGTQGKYQRAAQLFGASEALRANIGQQMTAFEQEEYDQAVNSLRASVDAASVSSAWAQGSLMTMEEAISYALEPEP